MDGMNRTRGAATALIDLSNTSGFPPSQVAVGYEEEALGTQMIKPGDGPASCTNTFLFKIQDR